MNWQDIGKKILEIAPTAAGLAAPFFGPVGPPLALAIKALCSVLDIQTPNPTPDQVHSVLTQTQADPRLLANLSLAQANYQTELMRAEFADLANARDRQTQHEKVTGKSDINMYLLAWLFVGGFFLTFILMLILIFTGNFPKDLSPAAVYLIGTMNGTLTAAVGAVVQYFFGKTKDTEAHFNQAANSVPLDQLAKFFEPKTKA